MKPVSGFHYSRQSTEKGCRVVITAMLFVLLITTIIPIVAFVWS